MSIKTDVESITNEFQNGMHEHAEDARVAVQSLTSKASKFVRDNPAACLIGAFVVGFALAKVARHA